MIENRGYKSLEGPCDALQNFDTYQVQGAGLWLPGWTVTGEQVAGQYRPDVPRTVTSEKGEPRVLKYETPAGANNYLDVHPMIRERVRESTESLFITEGIRRRTARLVVACCALV